MMLQSERQKYRKVLEAKEAELAVALQDRNMIAVEKTADPLDNLQLANQREFAISHLELESILLRKVRAALLRIENGNYGICLRCEEPISPKRLRIVPWASYCVLCQEREDRGDGKDRARNGTQELSDAA